MTDRRVVRVCAPDGDPFAQDALDGVVGDEFPLIVNGETYGTARCVEAEIADDGFSVLLCLETDRWPDGMVVGFEPAVSTLLPSATASRTERRETPPAIRDAAEPGRLPGADGGGGANTPAPS